MGFNSGFKGLSNSTYCDNFFIIIEFSIKPSREPTSEPHEPDLGRHLMLVTTHVEEAK